MRTRLGLLCGAIVVALALVSTNALASRGARIASSCLVQAVRPGLGKATQRVVLHGKVSCSQARRTYLAFLRDEDSGACGSGRICGVLQPGGWQCSFLSSVESKADGGRLAGCFRAGASFGVYNLPRRRASDSVACSNEAVTVLEQKPVAVTLRFVVHGVTCNKAHSLIRTYFRHQATPGYCRNRGNICAFVSGGWTCSLPLYAGEGGGDFAACIRENPFAQVKVFKASSAAAPASAKLPQPIYFWSNIGEPIGNSRFFHNPLVVRPPGFVLFQDGQWGLQDMHWTGWGSPVAHATGVSNSSNDIPNAAEGKRIKTWAHVTLSNPGRFQGHEVYRCFNLTVPPPAHYGQVCLHGDILS